MGKIKVYLDSGVSLPKDLKEDCECFQYPYDPDNRPNKNIPILASSYEPTWEEANCCWDETSETWEGSGSIIPERIVSIIGKDNKRDCKHLASAIKEFCKIFLTSDKDHVWSKREIFEEEFRLKIFWMPGEKSELRAYLKKLVINNSVLCD